MPSIDRKDEPLGCLSGQAAGNVTMDLKYMAVFVSQWVKISSTGFFDRLIGKLFVSRSGLVEENAD